MVQSSEASVLEDYKENIQPLPGGRSALGLLATFESGSTFKQQDQLNLQRHSFEAQLQDLEDLDDPLQVFIEYIRWCHEKYPQGNSVESGLLGILEKCTTYFKDFEHYRNDSRYLKIWLEYAKYSDSPMEIFIYLAKKEIGKDLALYYEEFAKVLEINEKYDDAKSVYDFGISINARPCNRLSRSLSNFERRKLTYTNDKSSYDLTRVLTLKRGANPNLEQQSSSETKKPKFSVLTDDSELRIGKNLFTSGGSSKEIGTIKLRKKENTFIAKPWKGEILPQKRPLSNESQSKISVYRDIDMGPIPETSITHEIMNNKTVTIVKKPGKPIDRVMVNTQLIYPTNGEETSLLEVLVKSRTPKIISESTSQFHEHTNTLIVPLKDDDSTLPTLHGPQSPTVTFYSKIANKEVLNMFNEASKNIVDNEDERSEANSTNYDGFVTETFHNLESAPSAQDLGSQALNHIPIKLTPPTQEIGSTQSSPFIEHPSGLLSGPVDPLSMELRAQLLSSLNPPLESYPGYNNSKTQFIEAIRRFRSITDSNTKVIKAGSSGIVNFCGDEIYSLKCELGQGGFGYVYLIENEVGHLKALKAETQSSNWEFYILNQIHRRLEYGSIISSRIIKPESLYLYKDESFLILPYLKQGTLLDIINIYKNENESVEEVLCIFFTIELLNIVENLHSIGIIHGDLKADNCMIDICDTELLSSTYSANGTEGWSNQKLVLIDFGRSIDTSMFSEGKQFQANFKTDQQDCPQMNNKEPWSFEADYYGIAAIIHTLLYGKYIEIDQLKNGKYKLVEPLKRYWQRDELWNQLFDTLLNPYYNNDEKYPFIDELRYQRKKFETWLETNSNQKGLKRVMKNLEFEVNKFHRRKIGY